MKYIWGYGVHIFTCISCFLSFLQTVCHSTQSHVRVGKRPEMENELRLATSEQRFAEERGACFKFYLLAQEDEM